jgi:hypothetical protein
MRACRLLLGLAFGLGVAASSAWAQPSSILVPDLFAFPGAVAGPPSAASAGVGLADLWLGDEPFGNPAALPARGLMLAPVFLRVSRQDLRAHSHDYSETSGYFDGAGARLSWPLRGVGLSLYAWQPVLRREDQAYTHVLPATPGTFKNSSTAREVRAGLAASIPWRSVRFGLAAEWTRRDDAYDYEQHSGDPIHDGTYHLDFSGDAMTFRAGVRLAPHPRVQVGAAVGYLPALDLAGTWQVPSLAESTVSVSQVRRGSAWEGGCSARLDVTENFHLLASAGGRSAQSWEGLGVSAGRDFSWSLGLDFHAAPDPWTLRLGLGQEQQRGVPEPRAGLVSLGLGWDLEGVVLDGAVMRRSIERPGRANSYDDRVVASATVPF